MVQRRRFDRCLIGIVLIIALTGLSCDRTSSSSRKGVTPEAELNETEWAIQRTAQTLEELKDARTQAVSASLRLPGDIKEAEERIEAIDRELASTEAFRQQTERDRAEFVKANENRLESLELQVRQEADRQYQAAVQEIAESRRKREEQRKRIGAQTEDQEEALFVRREERKARTRIDANASAVVEKERSRLSGRFAALSEGITAARQAHQELSAERDQAMRWLAEARSHVSTAKNVADASSVEIMELEKRLEELTARREALQTSITQAKNRQEQERQLAEAEAQRTAKEGAVSRIEPKRSGALRQTLELLVGLTLLASCVAGGVRWVIFLVLHMKKSAAYYLSAIGCVGMCISFFVSLRAEYRVLADNPLQFINPFYQLVVVLTMLQDVWFWIACALILVGASGWSQLENRTSQTS